MSIVEILRRQYPTMVVAWRGDEYGGRGGKTHLVRGFWLETDDGIYHVYSWCGSVHLIVDDTTGWVGENVRGSPWGEPEAWRVWKGHPAQVSCKVCKKGL